MDCALRKLTGEERDGFVPKQPPKVEGPRDLILGRVFCLSPPYMGHYKEAQSCRKYVGCSALTLPLMWPECDLNLSRAVWVVNSQPTGPPMQRVSEEDILSEVCVCSLLQ